MQRVVVLAAGVLTAGVLAFGRRRKRISPHSSNHHRHQLGKQQRQIVHAFSPSAPPSQPDVTAAEQAADVAAGTDNISSRPNMSYAYSSLLLLLSLAVAVYTVLMLLIRGQPDLAAAAALTWFLAAPAVLSLGKQRSAAAAAASVQAQPAEAAADATMVITELVEPPTKVLADFHGTWIKDAAASESMDEAMRLIRLNAVMRQAVKLIRGVQLSIEEDRFKFAVFSAISWFKLNEYFPWSGEVCENRRRDLRRGRSHGRVKISPKGTINLQYAWDDPYGGCATDEFSIDEQGRLRLYTVVNVGGQSASYVQVYRRKNSSGGGCAQHQQQHQQH